MKNQPFGDSCGSPAKAVIMAHRMCIVSFFGLLLSGAAFAEQPCTRGMHIEGVITDPTGAVIAGARVQAGAGATGGTGATAHYGVACVPGTLTTITADADGFAPATTQIHVRAGGSAHVNLQLAVRSVETNEKVSGNAKGASAGGR